MTSSNCYSVTCCPVMFSQNARKQALQIGSCAGMLSSLLRFKSLALSAQREHTMQLASVAQAMRRTFHEDQEVGGSGGDFQPAFSDPSALIHRALSAL